MWLLLSRVEHQGHEFYYKRHYATECAVPCFATIILITHVKAMSDTKNADWGQPALKVAVNVYDSNAASARLGPTCSYGVVLQICMQLECPITCDNDDDYNV